MVVVTALLAGACDLRHAAVLDPKGPIALAERNLLFDAFLVMMVVIVPIIVLTLFFAWRYRASNTKAAYAPKWAESARIDAITWLVPGQIYAMAGLQTRLQLLADQPGKIVGRNSMYSGGGFSDQVFEVLSLSQADFDAWVAKAKQAPAKLDAPTYTALTAKSRLHPITYYSAIEPKLFDSIIAKYTHAHHAPAAGTQPGGAPRR